MYIHKIYIYKENEINSVGAAHVFVIIFFKHWKTKEQNNERQTERKARWLYDGNFPLFGP